jgi:hypothetical protein
VEPTNDLERVKAIAMRFLEGDVSDCEIWADPLAQLSQRQLASDDLMEIIATELGAAHCYDKQPTRKYHVGTTSDYYSIWVDECGCQMFLKLLLAANGRLHITSFKKDRRYG